MNALELFGGDGSRHTIDYCCRVNSLAVWELDGANEASLRKNLPGAQIKITDSFREIHDTPNRYDLIVIDNSGGVYGPNHRYCEHFEIFDARLFRVARPESAVIIVNVFPDLRELDGGGALPERLSRRGAFYRTTHPELISIEEEMVPIYRSIVNKAGFDLLWHFNLRRTRRSKAYYLAMGLASGNAE